MPRKFTITTPTNQTRADAEGRAQVQFTVANTSGVPDRRLFRAVPLGDAQAAWLSLAGESERAFAADGVHQISVTATVPPGTPAGRYGFRLDSIAATRVGEEVEEGPAVYFDVAGSAAPKKSMAWLWIVIVAVLVIGGGVTWLMLRPSQPEEPVAANPETPADLIEVPDVASAQLDVVDAMRRLQDRGFQTKLRFERNEDVKLGSVFVQSVTATHRAPRGSAVELTVATAEEESLPIPASDEKQLSASTANALHDFFVGQRRVLVPDVRAEGIEAAFAARLLQIAGLRAVLKTEVATTARPGQVVSQDPDPGTEVRVGTPVVLYVASKQQIDGILTGREQVHLDDAGVQRVTDLFRGQIVAEGDSQFDTSSTQ
jgi:hypothetical protein